MFDKKKKNYAQGEMRPLSALVKKETDKNVYARKTVPPQKPVKNFIVDSEDGPKIYTPYYNQELPVIHEPEEAPAPTQPETSAPCEPLFTPEPEPVFIPEPKAEPQSEPEPEIVPEFRTESEVAPESEPHDEPLIPEGIFDREPYGEAQAPVKADPLPERKPVKATVTRRRRASVPNLSDKDARDIFFAQYVSSNRSKIQDIVDDAPKRTTRTEGNPFRRKRCDRPVISHLKEEPTAPPEPESIPAPRENPISDEVRPGLAEAIENAAKAVRLEREQINAALDDSDLRAAALSGAKVRAVVLTAVIAVCGALLLLGERSVPSSEESTGLTQMPDFSVSSYLKGDYTRDVSAYYNDTLPMKEKLSHIASFIDELYASER